MKKMNNKGFALVETLVVTIFIATVLIFLFIQLSNLSSSYEDSFNYNSVEGLYALDDIKYYIESDTNAYMQIQDELTETSYIDISDCSKFSDSDYCKQLLSLENVDIIILAINLKDYESVLADMSDYPEGLKTFISKINNSGQEPYRIIASFNNGTYATIRFGG
ncbi:MAG: hypothetical protein IJY25_00145 [Bacilli bacterium]|nr:hypothetical protein [Bacilli bacterium]